MADAHRVTFLELCRLRRSVRRFAGRPVERARLEHCVEAARIAPSASNKQPCRWAVFDDPAAKAALADAVFAGVYSASRRFADAPVLAVLLLEESRTVNRLAALLQGTAFQFVDAGIAGEHFVLAATEQGLGTCWIGWFDSRACARFLGLRGAVLRPVCLVAVGYPAEGVEPREPNRRPADQVAGWNRAPGGRGR